MSRKLLAVQALLIAALFLTLLLLGPASAEEHYHHPTQDSALHEQYYKSWGRPDMDAGFGCCGKGDCWATLFKQVDGKWYALKRTLLHPDDLEDFTYELMDSAIEANWFYMPDEKFEHSLQPGKPRPNSTEVFRAPRESPDGRSHVCALDMVNEDGSRYIFPLCAVLGAQG